jgi:hypothetical protein
MPMRERSDKGCLGDSERHLGASERSADYHRYGKRRLCVLVSPIALRLVTCAEEAHK